jgi:hypothetical protein
VFLLPAAAAGLLSKTAQPAHPALSPAQAQVLVSQTLATELRAVRDTTHPMRYFLRKTTPRVTTTKEIFETKDGAVARLVAVSDRPLNSSEEQTERARLDGLLADPSRQSHRKRSEEGDLDIVLKLLRMLPDAYLYQYAGPAYYQTPGSTVEKFTFHPNPAFEPPDLESEALKAMTGEIWIDTVQARVTRLEGHLQEDTDYGWGVLGKLDKGGWIVIEQAAVDGRQWRIARFQMRMDLRILFKERNIDTTEEMTQYRAVPLGLDYRQAIQMLRAGPGGPPQAGH